MPIIGACYSRADNTMYYILEDLARDYKEIDLFETREEALKECEERNEN